MVPLPTTMAVEALVLRATTVRGEQDRLRRGEGRRWSWEYAAHRASVEMEATPLR
jgi:hypothetical protein